MLLLPLNGASQRLLNQGNAAGTNLLAFFLP